MKIFFFILLFSATLHAQLTQHGVVVAKSYRGLKTLDTAVSGYVLTSNGGLSDPSWQPASGGSSLPDSSTHSGEYLQTKDGVLQWNSAVGGGDTDYTANNNWFGEGSGNTTLTGSSNVAAGIGSLQNLFDGYTNTGLGFSALNSIVSGIGNTAVGSDALEFLNDGDNNVAIGGFSGGARNFSGRNLPQTFNDCVFIGYSSGDNTPSNLSNTLIIGAEDHAIFDLYFSSGMRMNNNEGSPGTNYTIHGTAPSRSGADLSGGSITLAGGISTGSGTGGDIIFKSSPAGGSGTSDNALQENFRFTSAGKMKFTADHGTAGQVATTDGTGVVSWADVLNGWIATDATPPVLAPTVAAGTKGLAIGDTAQCLSWNSLAVGNQSLAGVNAPRSTVMGFQAKDTGIEGTAVGYFATVHSAGSTVVGGSAYDGCTVNTFTAPYPTSITWGGYNSLFGTGASCDNNPFNTAVGWSASTNSGRSEMALGDGAYANGTCALSIGSQSGINDVGVGRNRISIYSQDTIYNGNQLKHDSTTVINGTSLKSTNADQYLFGAGNAQAGTTNLFTIADGGRHGNTSTFNALNVDFDGTITAGNNFVAGASLGGAATPAAGTYAKDNAIAAWGNIASDATITSQYGNFSIVHTGTGIFTITLPTTPSENCGTVSLQGSTLGLSSAIAISGATVTVKTGVGAVATDEAFYFIITGRP